MMWLCSQVLLVLVWDLALGSPLPPSMDPSPAAENLALPVFQYQNPQPTQGEDIRNTGLSIPNEDPSNHRFHTQEPQAINKSDSGRAYRNIAFLNLTPDLGIQSAPSPIKERDSIGKMSHHHRSTDISFNHAVVPNYFVMNPPYSKVATGIESDPAKKGKTRSHLDERANELDSVKYVNLTLREQHLIWKKEMQENQVDEVDTRVYQVQNNIIVHSGNKSEKLRAPFKVNTTISGNKSQINIDNSTILKPLLGVEEKSAEKSLMLTTSKITNQRLLINNTGLNPNKIRLGPNEIRVSVTLKDKDGRKFIVPAIYTSKASSLPLLTNTEDLALIPVERNLHVNDIKVTSTRPDIATTEQVTTISEGTASNYTTTSRPDIVTTEPITAIYEGTASHYTTTRLPDIVTTEEISTISERIASLLSIKNISPSPVPGTSYRIPVTPIPSRIFPQSLNPLITKNGSVALSMAIAATEISENVMKLTTAPTPTQPFSTTDGYNESIMTAMISQTAGIPHVQDVKETLQGSSGTTGSDMTTFSVNRDQKFSPPDGSSTLSTIGSSQSVNQQTVSAQEIPSVDASLESLLLSSEKAFNESKKISQWNNSTEVPPFLKDIITKIDDRLTELIRETVARYVENTTNTSTGVEKAIPHQTSVNKINLVQADKETTTTPTKALTGQISLLRLSLDAALSSTTKAPVKSEPGQRPLIKIKIDGESSSPQKPLFKINFDGEPVSSPKAPTTKRPFFSRITGSNGILGLTQIEPILERITGEISSGADRVRKELGFLAEDSADNLMKNVEVASDRVSEISATSYRGALQTRDAMNGLLRKAVENIGKFVSNAVQDTVKTAFGTAQSVGQFIHDLNVNAMDGILSQGTTVRNLFSNTINDMSEATNRTVQVLSRVMEKNTQTLLDK